MRRIMHRNGSKRHHSSLRALGDDRHYDLCREIEVWATSRCSRDACKDPNKGCDGQCADCIALERSLNARYETILCGWAARLT